MKRQEAIKAEEEEAGGGRLLVGPPSQPSSHGLGSEKGLLGMGETDQGHEGMCL